MSSVTRVRRLLIADDDAGLRRLVAATLDNPIYEVLQAPDGTQALEAIQRLQPDLVLLDMHMPGLSGLEVCRLVKTNEALAGTAVIMLTGSDSDEDRTLSLAAGATAYLTKPFSPLRLLDLVEQIMEPELRSTPSGPGEPYELPAVSSKTLAAFMFADVRDFTAFTMRHGDEAANRLVQTFQQLVKRETMLYGGRKVKEAGDDVLLVFPSARQAVDTAIGLMKAVARHNAGEPEYQLAVGIGLDVGEPVETGGDYIGRALNRAARVTGSARSGQILATPMVKALTRDAGGPEFRDLGKRLLKGFDQPIRLDEIRWPGAPVAVPARDSNAYIRRLGSHVRRFAPLATGAVLLLCAAVVVALRPEAEPAPYLPGIAAPVADRQRAAKSITQIVTESRPFTVLITAKNREGAALGTGLIYDSRGLVATNAHVVEGADSVMVSLPDGTSVSASVLGHQQQPDVAVLRLPEGVYPAAHLADSSLIRVGEPVVVLGYPSAFTMGAQASASQGIISQSAAGLGGQYLQFDAALNPGNSGGPLLNGAGEVAGMNVARVENAGGRAVVGIGFAIPSDVLKQLLPELEKAASGGNTGRPVARLLSPTEAIMAFHRLIHAGEFGLAYSLVNARLKAGLTVDQFAQTYGYADKVGVQVVQASVISENDNSAEVSITVMISEAAGGQVKSSRHDQRWLLVREGQEWRLDTLLRSIVRPD